MWCLFQRCLSFVNQRCIVVIGYAEEVNVSCFEPHMSLNSTLATSALPLVLTTGKSQCPREHEDVECKSIFYKCVYFISVLCKIAITCAYLD